MAGSKGGGVAINALHVGDCKMAVCFKFGVTLKAFRGVESDGTVVQSPVFLGKLSNGSRKNYCENNRPSAAGAVGVSRLIQLIFRY